MFKFFARKTAAFQKSKDGADRSRENGQPDALEEDSSLNAGKGGGAQLSDTPLHIAARQGDLDALVLLHARSARDTARDASGEFAIHKAAAWGHADCMLYLLKNMGSCIDCVDAEGRTPLTLAVQNSHIELVKLLVARGADAVHKRSKSGLTVLHFCTAADVLRYLCRFTLVRIDQPDTQGRTLLMHASCRGHKEVISEALCIGADTSLVDQQSRNALHFACSKGHNAVVPLLVVAGCSSNDADADGFTAVERALLAQDAQSIYALYCAGALFTKHQLLLVGILLQNSSLREALAEQQLRAEAAPSAVAGLKGPAPSGLTISCGHVPFQPLTIGSFQHKMSALPDPVPRPPRTNAVAQLTAAYARLLRSSNEGAAHANISASMLASTSGAGTNVATGQHRDAPSDPSGHAALESTLDAPSTSAAPMHSVPHKRFKDARRDLVPQSLPMPNACAPSRMSAYCGPTSRPLFNSSGAMESPGDLYHSLSPPAQAAPDRSRSMAVTSSGANAADVGASSFWGRGKVLPRRMRASSESTGRRSSLLGNRASTYKRRDPWADSPEASEKGTRAPAPLDDLAVVRLSMSRRKSADEEDGIAEFEDMMARRVALFQRDALAPSR